MIARFLWREEQLPLEKLGYGSGVLVQNHAGAEKVHSLFALAGVLHLVKNLVVLDCDTQHLADLGLARLRCQLGRLFYPGFLCRLCAFAGLLFIGCCDDHRCRPGRP